MEPASTLALVRQVETIAMLPCWAVMAAFDAPLPVPADGLFVHDAPVSWAARDGDAMRPEFNYLRDADYCSGASIMVPRTLFEQLGGFDTNFAPAYYEDTDLSWRGLSRGWRYRYVPEAVTRHIHAASTGEGTPTFQHYAERNRLVMLAKNAPAPMALQAAWRFALVTASYARRDIVRPLLGLHRPNVEQVRRRTLSFLGFLAMLPAILPERRRIRRAANVPDAAVVARLVPR